MYQYNKLFAIKLGVQEDSIEIINQDGNPVLVAVDTNDEVKEYYLIDCRDSVPKGLKNQYDKEIILLFKNSIEEYRESSTRLLNAIKNKNTFYVIYTELIDEEELTIKIDDEINYLLSPQCNNLEGLKGRIINLPYWDIKQLYDSCGEGLFDQNIRTGIKFDPTKTKIEYAFNKYFYVGLNSYFERIIGLDDTRLEEIKKLIPLEIHDKENYNLDLFWFCHNGITICSQNGDEDAISFFGSYIKIHKSNVSIINGAQTLYNLRKVSEKILCDKKLEKGLKNLEFKDDELKKAVEYVEQKLKIKVVFVVDKGNNIRQITKGLNTQIPISLQTILAASKEVEEINEYLGKFNMKIVRDGEVYQGKTIGVLDIVKTHLLIEDKPGTSKNYTKKDYENYIIAILEQLKSDDKYINKIRMMFSIDDLWKEHRGENSGIFATYGKNYFKSYLMHYFDFDNYDKEINYIEKNYNSLFTSFVNEFSGLVDEVNPAIFKSDTVYLSYLDSKSIEN